MKNINKKDKQIDPLAEVKKSKNFKKFSKEAQDRIRLGMKIYNKRKKLDISQQKLAQKAQTTQKIISKIENGDVNIGFALLNRLGDALYFNLEDWGNIFKTPLNITISYKETSLNNFCVETKNFTSVHKKIKPLIPKHGK